ncbi:TPA: N-acetylmuramoyl-L-alanine amidase-like domain-containing protein, partial [Klebsiella pneumoniae]
RISYIPASAIDKEVINKLQTGDYVGIYSTKRGLDVSHVGIIIKDHNNIWFRNASSLAKNRKVVDSPFIRYMATKPGIVVLRDKTDQYP